MQNIEHKPAVQRVVHRQGVDRAALDGHGSFSRAHQQRAVRRVADGEDLVAGQPVRGRVTDVRLRPETEQAAVVKTDPDGPGAVLVDHCGFIPRQSLQTGIQREPAVMV